MKIGLNVIGHHSVGDSPSANFQKVIDQVQAARDAGFDLIWTGQHYLLKDRQKFQVVPAISRLAAECGDMYIGANVLVPLHHPVEIAEHFATIDAFTDGKVILGPVAGYRDIEFESFGIPKSERGGRMVEGIEVIKRLWTEDDVTYDGEYYSLDEASICPKPTQSPHPPVWIGANKDEAVIRASEMGDSWLINPHDTDDVIARQLKLIDPPTGDGFHGLQPAIKDGFVAETDEEALSVYEPYIKEFYSWYEEAGQGEAMETPEAVNLDASGLERFVIGSPETVADNLVALYEDHGIDCVILYMHRPGIDQAAVHRAIELVGDEVMPRVRERIDA